MIKEVDSVGNKTFLLTPSVAPSRAVYLAQDNKMIWLDKNNVSWESDLKEMQKKVGILTTLLNYGYLVYISNNLVHAYSF